jgi:hypothetical protein
MSLIDRATELEYYPEQQLIEMSQDPQGQYPQFLVLSEIQRRNNMRRMYQNEVNKMNQPTTTVAEESVMELAGQGAVPMMDSLSSLSSSEGGLRSMAPIPMKSGGITEMQSGRGTALEKSFDNPLDQESSNSFLDSLKKRYVNPDGTFNTAQIAKDGLSTALVASYFTPAGAIRGGLGLLGRGAMSLFKPFTAAGREGIKRSVGRQAAKINPKMVRDPKTGKFRSQAEIGSKAIGSVAKPLGLTAGVGILQAPDEDTSTITQDNVGLTDAEKNAASSLQDLKELLDTPTDTTTTQKQRFGSDDFLTLAQLGGILGGANTLGEAAMGIGNLAGQIQQTRRESKIEGLQGKLLEAQTAKYLADIANMDLDNALTQYQALDDLVEAGVLTPEEAKIREAALIQRINEFQGTAANTSQKSYSQFVS